jgi:ankyrin repeat protein
LNKSYQKLSIEDRQRIGKEYFIAVRDNNLTCLKECIDNGIPIETKDGYGKTALHYACGEGHLEVYKNVMQMLKQEFNV